MGKGGSGQLRIIGGRWRSRRLELPQGEVRPSPDRVRETLFNWLQPVIAGARCLDLFAGSGVLGLEALSRGAAEALFVDTDPRVVARLREHIALLGAEGASAVQADVPAFLENVPDHPFDVVFLDPPYRQGLVGPCCERLHAGSWLAPGARVYIEMEREAGEPALPQGWSLLRSKCTGQVGYHLAAAH
jgi:16S rRNA (guanine966-N2)-methyltransferase